MRRLLVLAALLFALPAQAVTIDWVPSATRATRADTPSTNCYAADCGSVAYDYCISKYEVTNAQYAEFLNAKAASDPLGPLQHEHGLDATFGGITRSGSPGSYTYAVKAGFENKPVNYVSFYDALRFANWLHNGQGSGDTETGAYTLLGGTATPSNGRRSTRNAGATIVPHQRERVVQGGVLQPRCAGYFDYPTGTDAQTGCVCAGRRTPATRRTAAVQWRAHGRRRLRSLGQPLRHVRPGRERVGVERRDHPFRDEPGPTGAGARYGPASHLAASSPGYSGPTVESGDLGFRVAYLPEGLGPRARPGLTRMTTRRARPRSESETPRELDRSCAARRNPGAGNGIRTRDPQLGKLMLYQLSYSRVRGGT